MNEIYIVKRNGKQFNAAGTLIGALFKIRQLFPEANLRDILKPDLTVGMIRKYKDDWNNTYEVWYTGEMK